MTEAELSGIACSIASAIVALALIVAWVNPDAEPPMHGPFDP